MPEDWIQQRVHEKERREQDARERHESDQRNRDLVRSKLPEFMARTEEAVREHVRQIAETGRFKLQYATGGKPGVFTVTSISGPTQATLSFRESGPSNLSLLSTLFRNGTHEEGPTGVPIDVGVDDSENVFLWYAGCKIGSPTEFSKALIESALDRSER